MRTEEIKNKIVKEIVAAAIKNDFKVTVADLSNAGYMREYGKAFYRIRKEGKGGWDVVADLAKTLGKLSINDILIGKAGDKTHPQFIVLSDSIIICDPVG